MKRKTLAVSLLTLGVGAPVYALDVTDNFSIGGVLSAAGQCQSLSDDGEIAGDEGDDECNAGMPLQPEFHLRLTEDDEFFMKLGFAAGNALNSTEDNGNARRRSPFTLTAWAADLEDDVEDINGRNRDYLLTGWYKHTFRFENWSLGTTFGFIDSTDYLDENAYANDEYTQFMNEVFVNAAQANLPSYDAGGALEWEYGNWILRGVVMNIGKNGNETQDANEYNYFGATLGYTLNSSWGEGNYRVTVGGTNERFENTSGNDDDEGLIGGVLSFDQQLGNNWGVFIRAGWQDDDAAEVTHDALYSGGLDISGAVWGRGEDNVGVGFAYLDGANDLDETTVFETYYRATLGDYFALTADVQWMNDDYESGGGEDAKGWIFGLRTTAEF